MNSPEPEETPYAIVVGIEAIAQLSADIEAELVNAALARANGNVSAAARLLGVHRSWFYRRR